MEVLIISVVIFISVHSQPGIQGYNQGLLYFKQYPCKQLMKDNEKHSLSGEQNNRRIQNITEYNRKEQNITEKNRKEQKRRQ